ncbi:MAG: radical SAM/SPASM domain-containing protein [Patescibacteria group bacterium]
MANFYPLSNFDKSPKDIAIEVTNNCNLRCPVCPTNFAMNRERGFMDFEMYKSIIDEFKEFQDKPRITFIFAGEPLLHPQIDQFIAYASQHSHDTFLSTNAMMLSEELSKKIIAADLKLIHLCLDGATKESHEAYRFGSNFETVKQNIENFLTIKRNLNRQYPSVCIQSLLTSFSENENTKILDWARSIGADSIQFKSLSLGSVTTLEMRDKYQYLLPKNEKYLRKKSKIKKTVCTVPLTQAVVCWNGDLGLCCIDVNTDVKMPNIKGSKLLKQFFSPEAKQVRKDGLCKKYKLCQNCSLSQSDFMGWHVEFNKS